MSTLEDLQKSRDFLAANEWGQGQFSQRCADDPTKTSYCGLGAIIHATREGAGRRYQGVRQALADILKIEGEEPWIAEWNDTEGRTKAEVLELFDKAILAEYAKLGAGVVTSTPSAE